MGALNLVLTALGTIASGFINVIVNVFTGVIPLWYVAPVGEGTGDLTILGVFSLMAFVVGLVWMAISFIGSIISLRHTR